VNSASPDALAAKIAALPADRIAEIVDFVEFLHERERARSLSRAAAAVSTPTFAAIWANPEDDVYDAL
jgi:hypothetical protein